MALKIALTGATGFVGRFLARAFASQGWQVRALVRDPKRQAAIKAPLIHWIPGDLADLNALRQLVEGVDAVVHCAGTIRGITLEDFWHVNVDGVEKLLQACHAQTRIPRFCMISSLAAREPTLSNYALSKYQGEDLLRQQNKLSNWVILRPPAIYGPEDLALLPLLKLIYRGIAPIAAAPESRFSLIHVEDLVSAVVRWLQLDDCPSNTYEICDDTGTGYSWQEVIAAVQSLRKGYILKIPLSNTAVTWIAHLNASWAKLRGRLPVLTPDKVNELYHLDWICDNSSWSQITGWQPQVSLAQGLESCLHPTKTR